MLTGEVWSPGADRVDLVVDGRVLPMSVDAEGIWRSGTVLAPGARYGFLIDGDGDGDGGAPMPDPRSRWQPDGPDGASEAVDEAIFEAPERLARPVAWPDAVVYEMHVGTFSGPGTFLGAIDHLDALVDIGVTHVELMPLAGWAGRHGWGYDGVNLFAPHAAYGSPGDLRALIGAAHSRGLAVIVDVVLNHTGPTGSYLRRFGPYFTDRYRTPWGDAFNVDGPDSDQVRSFLIDGALSWIRDYGADGLRVDAAHAIIDTSAVHLLEELTTTVARLSAEERRPLVMVAEWDRSDPRIVRERDAGGVGFDAQWADDLHHAVHATLTGERQSYYADFDGGVAQVIDVLRHTYAFRGTYSRHHRRHVGRDPGPVGRDRFVVGLQNHDQVGNRAAGERLTTLVDVPRVMAVAPLVLLGPSVPMIFQGEEWAASTPFPYFVDFTGQLADDVRQGRRAEFSGFGGEPGAVLDPTDPATARRARLRWDERAAAPHADMLEWYRTLIDLRHSHSAFRAGSPAGFDQVGPVIVMDRGPWSVVTNLSDSAVVDVRIDGEVVLRTSAASGTSGGLVVGPGGAAVVSSGRS